MAHKSHRILPAEHYSVMLALVISLITSFLLGILLTGTLWNSGLNYFGKMSAEKKYDRMMKSYTSAVQAQWQAQAAQAQMMQ